MKSVIVNLDEGVNEKELLTHDQFCEDSTLANLLSGFDYPDFPVPMGILRQVEYTPLWRENRTTNKNANWEERCGRSGSTFKG